jgi:uncharacterized protein YhbP (UPF0306 family)
MDVEGTLRQYIEQVIHMSLATSHDNKPWVCEVHFAYDDELNLYFRSLKSRRHSQEIANNPSVAGNIVTQHHKGQAPRGVYFEGKAEMLTDIDETHPAYVATAKRFGAGEDIFAKMAAEESAFYKIAVSDFYIFDAYVSKPAQKYHLPWSK